MVPVSWSRNQEEESDENHRNIHGSQKIMEQ